MEIENLTNTYYKVKGLNIKLKRKNEYVLRLGRFWWGERQTIVESMREPNMRKGVRERLGKGKIEI